jgi:hypothetical protein
MLVVVYECVYVLTRGEMLAIFLLMSDLWFGEETVELDAQLLPLFTGFLGTDVGAGRTENVVRAREMLCA